MASGAIERYLLEFNEALVAGGERRERILAEVEDHLRDATDSLVAAGSKPDDAEAEAVGRFGSPTEAAERFGPDPLGRAQRASRWYEARRIAHPWALPLVLFSPWFAAVVWFGWSYLNGLLFVFLLYSTITRNLELRRRAGGASGSRTPGLLQDRPRLNRALQQAFPVAFLGGMLALTVPGWSGWFQAISGYYVICATALYWARPNRCGDPECNECTARWAVRHPTAGAAVRGVAWALALAGPALAHVVPVAEDRWGMALLALTLMALLPLPSRRAAAWLRRQRPAIRVALRAAPLLTLLALHAVVEPRFWILSVIAGCLVALAAIQLEIRAGRSREDETHRRLHARAHGFAGGGTSQ